jgi:hypothetical protein
MNLRRGAGLAAAVLASAFAAGCFAERHRVDAPRVSLALDRTSLRPGEDITGSVTAVDGSGITNLGVRIVRDDDTARYRFLDFVRMDSVEFDFRIDVVGTVVGDTIIVIGYAQDTDLFLVSVEDTLVVREGP